MGIQTDYPAVIGIYPSQSVLVYDAHFDPIDSIPEDAPTEITRRITGPKGVDYFRLLRSPGGPNATDPAYVRASAVRIISNPWDEIPHHGRLQTRLRGTAGAIRRALTRSDKGLSRPQSHGPDDSDG